MGEGLESGRCGHTGFLRGTRSAIILTAVAVALCALSLNLPMYGMTYYDEVESPERVYIVDESFAFFSDYLYVEDRAHIFYTDNPVGALMDNMKILIIIWIVVGIIYIASCVVGSRALIRGFVLAACSVIPAVYFAAKMPSAIGEWGYLGYHFFTPEDFWGSISSHPYDDSSRTWGPMWGWLLLALACVVQVAAIIRRNAPMVAAIINQRRRPNVARRGDREPESE